MTIQTDSLLNSDNPLIPWKYVGVRDTEDARTTTSGSLSNLPNIYQGTTGWHLWEDDILYSFIYDPFDYKNVGTGTCIIEEKVQVRGPVTFRIVVFDESMVRLQRAANAGDEHAFLQAENAIDWETRPPKEILQGVQFALAAGAHLAARRIASQGASRFPNDEQIQRYVRVLAPPRIVSKETSPRSDLKANRDWLQAHRNEYQGQWIALRNGELLGAAQSLRELKDQVGNTEKIFFMKVY
ncbi:MAG: hypothetical protein AB1345_12660 [Chloroflexota bacterium]